MKKKKNKTKTDLANRIIYIVQRVYIPYEYYNNTKCVETVHILCVYDCTMGPREKCYACSHWDNNNNYY